MKSSVLLALGVVLAVGTGCSSPAGLRASYLENHVPRLVEQLQDVNRKMLEVNVRAIDDRRGEKEVLGMVAGRMVRGDNLTDWVAAGLTLLNNVGYRVTFEKDKGISAKDTIDLNVEIKAAHIRSISTSMSATLVLGISYSVRGRLMGSKIYRGVKTSLNWVSGESEINELFCQALVPILKEASNDMACLYQQLDF